MQNKFILILGLMLMQLAHGTTFTVDGSNIRSAISDRDFNRISFKNDKVNQAFFKASEFLIQMDDVNGQLFVLPRNKKHDHPLSLTVTSASGLTQHFFFTPKNIGSQTIILRAPGKPVIVQEDDEKLAELMDLLIKEDVKFTEKPKSISVKKGFDFTRLSFHKFDDGERYGHLFKLMNVGDKPVAVNAKMLWRDNTQALSIVDKELRPLGVTKVYMITKGDF